MNRNMGVRPSVGKVILCSVIGLILGLIQPIALMLQVMMPMPVVVAAMIAGVVLFACAGAVPAVTLGISSFLSSAFVFGVPTGAIITLFWLIPAAMIVLGIHHRKPFFQQVSTGIVAAIASVVLGMMGMALIFGTDMVAKVIDQLRLTFESQQMLFWEMLSPMFNGELTQEQFVQAYYDMFNILQLYYEQYLLSNLLTGAIISVLAAALWGNWIRARRGEATAQSYCGLGGWYLSANTTFGLILTLVAGFILSRTSIRGANMAWIIVESLGTLAFSVQCLAAMDRRMKRGGSGHVRRIVLLGLLVVFASMSGFFDVMAIAGCASALFGSKGAAKPLINKMKDKMDGEDR